MAQKPAIIYRPFLGLEVKQDIDTMLYNANDILKAYNKNNNPKKLEDFMDNKSSKEFIKQIELEENLIPPKSGELKISVVKTKRGKYGGTWMHPKILMDLMMWLSPEFKSKAYDFIINGYALAGKRNELKEGYKKMMKAIGDNGNTNFREEATMINVLCTGSSARNQRARLDIDKMSQMDNLQGMNATLIKAGLSLEKRKDVLVKEL